MGITYASIELRNPVRPDLKPVAASALADTGALHLCIPQHIALQLMLNTQEEREVTLADGSKALVPYVGPLNLRFENRQCFVGALVMGDEILLGAIPMEDMDLVVLPMTRQVKVNPASPNIPSSVAKGMKETGRKTP